MGRMIVGVILIVIGVIAFALVHSMRPPSGLGDAMTMMGQGREQFIKEPIYQILLAISGLVAVFGAFLSFTGWKVRSSSAPPQKGEGAE